MVPGSHHLVHGIATDRGELWRYTAGVTIIGCSSMNHPAVQLMDIEEQTGLLAPTPEYLETVRVFPLIPHIRKDAMVRVIMSSEFVGVVLNLSARSP